MCRSTDKKEEAHKQELSGIFHLILVSHGRLLINVSGLTFKVYGEDVFVSVVPHQSKELKLQSGREIPVVRTIRRTCTVPQGVRRSVSRGTGGPEYGRFISRYLGLALRMPRKSRRVPQRLPIGSGYPGNQYQACAAVHGEPSFAVDYSPSPVASKRVIFRT